jgi:preprotein translocase subunit SecY
MSDGKSVSNVRFNSLARRIAITIGALLVFRLGSYIPVPGIDHNALEGLVRANPGSIFAAFVGANGVARISIFALGVVPYVSAAIIVQLLSVVWGRLSSLVRSGEAGRRSIARYTLLLTLPFAMVQAYGIAATLETIPGMVSDPDGLFVTSATASMVGGVFFLIWLSELITRYGIGNGLALVLSVGVFASLPGDVAGVLRLIQDGGMTGNFALLQAALWFATVILIVFIETARRRVPVVFAERKQGDRSFPAQSGFLSIKINSAGFLIPVTLESWALSLPLLLPLPVAALLFGFATPWVGAAFKYLKFGQPAHLVLGSIAVFVIAFIYSSYVIDPDHAAEQLSKRGGTIPGVEPGEPTAAYLDRVMSFTTLVGAIYLTALTLILEMLLARGLPLSYNIGGGAALIVVCTVLDIQKQVRDISRIYPGADANENYTSGTAGFGKGDPGTAAG